MPLGLKNFILAAPDGVVLDFLFYAGEETVLACDKNKLRLGGAVAKKLCESIPPGSPHVIYTDRFFTSLKSVEHLLESNIYQTGTVQQNRTDGVAKFLKEDKKMKRGEWDEMARDDEVCVVKWKDTKTVTHVIVYRK